MRLGKRADQGSGFVPDFMHRDVLRRTSYVGQSALGSAR